MVLGHDGDDDDDDASWPSVVMWSGVVKSKSGRTSRRDSAPDVGIQDNRYLHTSSSRHISWNLAL